jgi:hypothetical protein
MQHLTSSQREEDVADEEIPKKASPYRSRVYVVKGIRTAGGLI